MIQNETSETEAWPELGSWGFWRFLSPLEQSALLTDRGGEG